jgi:hypothetical protein
MVDPGAVVMGDAGAADELGEALMEMCLISSTLYNDTGAIAVLLLMTIGAVLPVPPLLVSSGCN